MGKRQAYKGVALVTLQALMGWSDLATAQKYIEFLGQQPLTLSVASIIAKQRSPIF